MVAELLRMQISIERIIIHLNGIAHSPPDDTAAKTEQTVKTERTVPLNTDPSLLEKKRPVAVVFNGERVFTPTWKKVFEAVLSQCNQDPIYHERLMALRNKPLGSRRAYLSDKPDGMRLPIEIYKEMHFEIHNGVKAMMSIVVNKILSAIDYDYSNIDIIFRA